MNHLVDNHGDGLQDQFSSLSALARLDQVVNTHGYWGKAIAETVT